MANKDFKVKNGLITEANNVTIGNNFFISNTGKVGIGTAPTDYALTVDSSNTVYHAIRAYSSVSSAVAGTSNVGGGAANSTGVYGGVNNTAFGLVGHYNSNTSLYYSFFGNDKGYFANNVGIACTSPTVALDVVGNVNISGTINVNSISALSGSVPYATAAGSATTATTANSLSGSAIGYSSSAYAGNQTGVTGIPTWARRISVLVYDITGQNQIFIQLGYDGNWLQNNYNSVGSYITTSGSAGSAQFYQGISFAAGYYAFASSGIVTFERWGSSNVWVASGTFSCYQPNGAGYTAGRIDLGASASSYYNVRIGSIVGFNGMSGSFVCQWA